MGDLQQTILEIILKLPGIILALSVHECAHAWMALKMGDPTARNFGRITLNPAKHIDPIGFVCMMLFSFGWARPVPTNPRNFKGYRKGLALTAAAGPISNVILGFIFIILTSVFAKFAPANGFTIVVYNMLYLASVINISLAVFNLLPIPPLDGSKIFITFLPPRASAWVMRYDAYSRILLLALLWSGLLTPALSYLVGGIYNGALSLVGLIGL